MCLWFYIWCCAPLLLSIRRKTERKNEILCCRKKWNANKLPLKVQHKVVSHETIASPCDARIDFISNVFDANLRHSAFATLQVLFTFDFTLKRNYDFFLIGIMSNFFSACCSLISVHFSIFLFFGSRRLPATTTTKARKTLKFWP